MLRQWPPRRPSFGTTTPGEQETKRRCSSGGGAHDRYGCSSRTDVKLSANGNCTGKALSVEMVARSARQKGARVKAPNCQKHRDTRRLKHHQNAESDTREHEYGGKCCTELRCSTSRRSPRARAKDAHETHGSNTQAVNARDQQEAG